MDQKNEITEMGKVSFSLNQKELSALKAVIRVGLASFSNLRNTALGGCTVKHAQLVMRTLVNKGCVLKSFCDCGSVLGWYANKHSATVRNYFGKIEVYSGGVPLIRSSHRHFTLLTELRDLYLSSPAISGWVNSGELKRKLLTNLEGLRRREQENQRLGIPDGMILLKRGDREVKIALELEIMETRARRIKKKLENHITSNTFEFTFFIVEGERLIKRFMDIYRKLMSSSIEVKLSLRKNGIYFAKLSDVQKLGLAAPFKSLTNSIAISEFHPKIEDRNIPPNGNKEKPREA